MVNVQLPVTGQEAKSLNEKQEECLRTTGRWSHVFSVKAVRLKWRISWWRGSGFLSVSSSSSSSSSMAFWFICCGQDQQSWNLHPCWASHCCRHRNLLISHQSSCPRMSNPQSPASFACRRPRTCWLLCACENRGTQSSIGVQYISHI